MSVKHLALAADINGITSTCKLVLLALAYGSDERGFWSGTYATLQQRTCLSERAIRDALGKLEARGFVFRNAPYWEIRL